MNVAGRAAIDSANTTEEILNVNETNPVTEKETEPAENTEILVKSIGAVENSITTWAGEADEATKLNYCSSDTEKYTVDKVAVDAKGEAAKDFKIGPSEEAVNINETTTVNKENWTWWEW